MIAYPDTSLLCAIYRMQGNSEKAGLHFAEMKEPLHVTSLLLFEFRQSVRLQAYLYSKDKSKGYSNFLAQEALAALMEDIESRAVVIVPFEFESIIQIANHLSEKYTSADGCRAFDLLHLATASHLGATEFLTFDLKQKQLAIREGFSVPF